jgi:hypothetical protein
MSTRSVTISSFFAIFTWLGLFGVEAPVAWSDDAPQKGAVSAKALYYDKEQMASVTTQQKQPQQAKGPKKTPAAQSVLALRVAVKLISEGGSFKEVKPSTVFRSGDRIRLAFTSNKEGYLYLATFGSSGKADLLLPDKSGRLVTLQPGFTYEYPLSAKALKFDTQVGEEQLYAFLSEAPLGIIDFGDGQQVQIPSSSSAKPGPEPGRAVAYASAVRSRDLVVEEDTEALYAAVAPGRQDGKPPVVVKMTPTHRDSH